MQPNHAAGFVVARLGIWRRTFSFFNYFVRLAGDYRFLGTGANRDRPDPSRLGMAVLQWATSGTASACHRHNVIPHTIFSTGQVHESTSTSSSRWYAALPKRRTTRDRNGYCVAWAVHGDGQGQRREHGPRRESQQPFLGRLDRGFVVCCVRGASGHRRGAGHRTNGFLGARRQRSIGPFQGPSIRRHHGQHHHVAGTWPRLRQRHRQCTTHSLTLKALTFLISTTSAIPVAAILILRSAALRSTGGILAFRWRRWALLLESTA